MTQQEIKENLPKLPYWVNPSNLDIKKVTDDCENTICIIDTNKGVNVNKGIALAIHHAINNTYGKNINPESVSEMYNALQSIHQHFSSTNSNDMADTIKDILNKTTL